MGKIPRHANSKPPKDTWEEQSICLSLRSCGTKSPIPKATACISSLTSHVGTTLRPRRLSKTRKPDLARIKNVPFNVAAPDPEAYLDKVEWSEDVIPEMDEITFGYEGELFGVEGFEVIDPSFSVIGWGPDEWYATKKVEEEVKDYDEIRKTWEACWAVKAEKAAAGGGRRRGCGGGMNYLSSRRRYGGGRYLWQKRR